MKFNKTFFIDNKEVGENSPVYIIAEMSANHGNDIGKALELVHAAKESGADAIKLQTYTADTLTLNCESDVFFIKKGPWKGQYLYDLYKGASMPWEWHEKLKAEAEKIGLTLFSTAFDPTSVELLHKLDMPAYKIASPELIDLELIRQVVRIGKPVILSTGNANLIEINEALTVAVEEGAKDICLLKCTSVYPAPPEEINLKTIPHMKESFKCIVGLSDHTMGIGVPIASIAFGATIIEKHFTMNRSDNTVDSFFSATPDEFKAMVDGIRMAEKAVGEISYPIESNPAQRSLIAVKDIKKGDFFTSENIKSLRPGGGILPKYIVKVLKRRANIDIKRGTPLSLDMIGGF